MAQQLTRAWQALTNRADALRRALSLVLCLCLALAAVEPAAAADFDGSGGGSVVYTTGAVDHAPADPSDHGLAQHCAHCCCHQQAQIDSAAPVAVRSGAKLRFVRFEAQAPTWAVAPPAKPPRS